MIGVRLAPLVAVVLVATAPAARLSPSPAPGAPEASPAARLSAADSASEYWDLTALFDSGHRFFARFSITNEGPGSETAFAIGHVILPDGRAVPFKNGRRKGRWSLSEDGLHIKVGSSELDQRSSERHVEVDKSRVQIDLRFTPDATRARRLDTGRARYQTNLLHSAAPVEGSLWVRGMDAAVQVRGRLGATHTWMEESEPELALRRIEFFSLGPHASLYLTDFTAPGGERWRWLVLEREGRPPLATPEFQLALDGKPVPGGAESARYPVPRTLRIRSEALEGEIRLADVLLRHDPLGVIPQPFRWILRLKMRPRRVWIESPFEVRLTAGSDDSSYQLTGSGITSFTFLNPLGPEDRKASAGSGSHPSSGA